MPRGGKGYLYQYDAVTNTTREFDTLTCHHCNRVVVLNPERKRERGWCPKCDAYVCDNVVCRVDCNPFEQSVEFALRDGTNINRGPNGEILFDELLKENARIY